MIKEIIVVDGITCLEGKPISVKYFEKGVREKAPNSNAYLFYLSDGIDILDPGIYRKKDMELEERLEFMRARKVRKVAATHTHIDHIAAFKSIGGKAKLYVPECNLFKEKDLIFANEDIRKEYLKNFGLKDFKPKKRKVEFLKEGKMILGGYELEVMQTLGHSPNHICLYEPTYKILFSGDLIATSKDGSDTYLAVIEDYKGRKLYGSDKNQVAKSLEKVLEKDIKILCPGHGKIIREVEDPWTRIYGKFLAIGRKVKGE